MGGGEGRDINAKPSSISLPLVTSRRTYVLVPEERRRVLIRKDARRSW